MKTRALALVLSAFGLSLSALADDGQVLSEIHHANQGEIQLAELATSRSLNPAVVDYARKLIKDHTAADQKTLALAKQEKIPVKKLPMTPEETADKRKLSNLSSDAFDEEFNKVMISDHKKVIGQLSEAEQTVSDPKVKSLIASLLPTLHHHYDIAMNLESRETGM